MKALFNLVCVFALVALPEVNAQFAQELRDDVTFIENGLQDQDPCYVIKLGDLESTSLDVSIAAARDALSNEITAVASNGCESVDKVSYTGLHIVYSDGNEIDYPAEMMQNLRDHAPSAERLLHNAVSMELNELKILDAKGNMHDASAKWTIKG